MKDFFYWAEDTAERFRAQQLLKLNSSHRNIQETFFFGVVTSTKTENLQHAQQLKVPQKKNVITHVLSQSPV